MGSLQCPHLNGAEGLSFDPIVVAADNWATRMRVCAAILKLSPAIRF